MLKSVLQQLASTSVSARLDAYLAINGALKAYDNLPEPKAFEQNMDQIMRFVMRDVVWKDESGKLDTNIVTQSLKLACAIACDEKHSKAINDEFRAFLVDKAIVAMEGTDVSKAIVKTQMFLVAQQRFSASVWTPSRAERCITALNTIDSKVNGNNVIATRLVIYQRLLSQARQVMLNRIRDWLDHIFHAMLSSVKEVRVRAIETGRKAALDLGTHYAASKSLSDMMSTQVEEGQSYCDYLSLRLQQMIDDKEMNIYVPQIWAATILFFRNKKVPLEFWPGFKTWLKIMSKCLNRKEERFMRYSMLGWNKLIYVVQPDKSTIENMSGLIATPTAQMLQNSCRDLKSKKLRPIILEGYYNLLHYALRPGLEFESLDKAWDRYVEPALLGLAKLGSAGRSSVCRILHGLLIANDGVWNSDAALKDTMPENTGDGDMSAENALFRPDELPMLPVKWVRTRLAKIFKIVEPCLQSSFWKPVDACADTDAAWQALMQAISEAGRQEVKTSQELKEAIALLVKMFRSLWTSPRPKPDEADDSDFVRRVGGLFDTTVDALGASVFTEDILARTRQDDIEAAPTPSHRSSKHHVSLQSPLVFLLGLLLQPTFKPCEQYYEIVYKLLAKMCGSKTSEAAKVELLRRCWQSVSKTYGDKVPPTMLSAIWQQVARCSTYVLRPVAEGPVATHGLHGLKSEIDNLLTIINDGLKYTESDMAALDPFLALYTATAALAQNEAGNGALVYAVAEPFAKTFRTKGTAVVQTSTMQVAQRVLETAPWVPSKQALEQGRRALLGVSLPPNKAPYNPFENVFAMITDLLVRTYSGSLEVRALHEVVNFVKKVQDFLQRAPSSLWELAVRSIQDGIAVWLADAGVKTGPNHNYAGVADAVSHPCDEIIVQLDANKSQIEALYTEVLTGLLNCSEANLTLAQTMERLLVAGLSSPHRSIVSATIVYWNQTFGTLEDLEYPPQLEAVLRARGMEAEISLPGLSDEPGHVGPASLPPFFESTLEEPKGLKPPKLTAAPPRATQSAYFTAGKSPRPQSSGVASAAPSEANRQPGSASAKTKLRHEDSQIDFAPIESTPMLHTEESQHLTEHQQEVMMQQRQDALIFPDLSSSPMAHSTALPKQVPRRLDFSSSAVDKTHGSHQQREQTPTGTPDAASHMNDYMGSSPTPKASEKAAPGVQATEEQPAEEEVEAPQDPPSSPPREDGGLPTFEHAQHQADEGDTTLSVTWEPTVASTALQPGQPAKNQEAEEEVTLQDGELPSDCGLPNEQLHQEETIAQERMQGDEHERPDQAPAATGANVGNIQGDHDVDATEYPSNPSSPEKEHEAPGENRSERSFAESTEEDDVSRVENSFSAPQPDMENVSPATSRRSRRTNGKRKRESASTTPRKRKDVSPYKKPFTYLSSFFRKSQQAEDDDDIGDEIVVASSQPSESPASKREAASPSKEVDVPGTVDEEPSQEFASSQQDASASMPPPKRGRGRPRKSATPTSQPSQSADGKLKRTASALSNSTTHSCDESETSFVKDTPAPVPRKMRKREGSGSKLVRESQEAEAEASQNPPSRSGSRSSQRRSPTVMVPRRASAISQNSRVDEDDAPGTPARHASAEQLAERAIATPRSILARLRGVLADCGKMILGSQEEREFDDALFELRREVHDAARRGRET
ncbi:hypothetical protein MBLNU230_g8247t1 [Neophaeotheca triangularis]